MSKMTDEQIKKALECIASEKDVLCKNCAYNKYYLTKCHKMTAKDALDLIKRQQAEIEKQKRKKDVVIENYQNLCDKYVVAGAEAIKEFAERLKGIERWTPTDLYVINNLVKEMVGEQE